ncbi:MAG: hypothetical protein OEZ11_11530 [Gammaproteobacteria bacterium]|nr:hypothetical protein [Gammaproteobacteria bacterium]
MYADAVFHEQPDWSRRPGRRLALNFLPSTLIVVAALMLLRLPVMDASLPLTGIVVRILASEARESTPPLPAERAPDAAAPATPDTRPVTSVPAAPPEARDSLDWYELIPDAARTAAAERPQEYSINPGMDARRRYAAENFPASQAPVERPVWENVERDTLGRTLLRSGDCYRVVDDPNVGSREAFETFGQFIVSCGRPSDKPRELPWVNELRNRREGQVRYGHPAVE